MLEAELALAHELADEADRIALALFGTGVEVRRKPDHTPVTEADTKIEAILREGIARHYPDDAILGEEEGMAGSPGGRTWIVDPIDGTKNFADGIQIWGTLIALAQNGEPVLGVVSAPALQERYHAVRGGGAYLNGEPIRVSRTAVLDEAFLAFGGLEVWVDAEHRDAFSDLVRTVRRARGVGDFWGHALVARGAADAMIEPELRIWDWAAVQVVVEEAGGRITQLDGSPLADRGSVLSSNGILHEEIGRRLARPA